MTIVMGPVLRFRGASKTDDTNTLWSVSALVVVEGEDTPKLSYGLTHADQPGAAPITLLARGSRRVLRYDFAVRREVIDRDIVYRIGDAQHEIHVPARASRPRMAYASCNGFSSQRSMKSVKDKEALWKVLQGKHAKAPYHLLLLGGDQVYSDSMWESVPPLRDWNELSVEEGNAAPFTGAMKEAAEQFFFDLYCRQLARPEIAKALASIPTLMMWDDHDIFDGWGSYPKERQQCPVFQGIFAIARRSFATFQLQVDPEALAAEPGFITPTTGFSYMHRIDDITILAADLRSERTIEHVASQESWARILERLYDDGAGSRHLLVLSSIPVVYPDVDAVERGFGLLPGQQEIEDDLRDHWSSRPHRAERLRIVYRLLDFAKKNQARVTILSGDVHVAALGTIESRRPGADESQFIIQLISSGIVHPPVPAAARMLNFFCNHFQSGREKELDRGVIASIEKFPQTEDRLLGRRNWLSLEPDTEDRWESDGRIWANWYVEGEDEPYTKVIHPAR